MRLSNRLKTIAEFVVKNSRIADIGTDHAYIPAYLIKNNIITRAIASDISQATLEKAREYIKKEGLEKEITLRLGDGLQVLKAFEVDTIILAGMGGILIKDILDKDMEITSSIENFILQPMVASFELRKYLLKNSFEIVDEELAKEGRKIYEIIYAKRTNTGRVLKENLLLGPKLIEKKHPLLKEFILNKLSILYKIERELMEAGNHKMHIKYREVEKDIGFYKEVLKKIEG